MDSVRRGTLKLAGDLCAVYLDDPRCAAAEYRELVKRYPTAPEAFEARERLGDLDVRIGDVKGAVEAWRDQVATAPNRPGADLAQLKIARALLDQGQFHDARTAASELQRRWPKSPLAAAAGCSPRPAITSPAATPTPSPPTTRWSASTTARRRARKRCSRRATASPSSATTRPR